MNLKMIYISNLNEHLIVLYFKLVHLNEIYVLTVTMWVVQTPWEWLYWSVGV